MHASNAWSAERLYSHIARACMEQFILLVTVRSPDRGIPPSKIDQERGRVAYGPDASLLSLIVNVTYTHTIAFDLPS